MNDDPVRPIVDPNLRCPSCEMQFEFHTGITGDPDQPLHKGMIMVCANCAAVLRMGDSQFQKMTGEQQQALSNIEKSILKLTVASVLAHNMQQRANDRPRLNN